MSSDDLHHSSNVDETATGSGTGTQDPPAEGISITPQPGLRPDAGEPARDGDADGAPADASAEAPRAAGGGGRRTGATLLVAALGLGFAGGIGGYVVAEDQLGGGIAQAPAISEPAQPNKPSNATSGGEGAPAGSLTPREIYAATSPGVVHVTARVTVQQPSIFGFGGESQDQEGVGTGSGFVIDKDGHIVTNAHVIQGADSVSVSFSDDQQFDAKVVGMDVSTDMAVLKVDAGTRELRDALSPLSFADSSQVQVGDPVVAIGNPFNLDRTLTTGVVSALQRQIRAQNNFTIDDVIQTDAAINPGNSGGPLLNMRGEVIGVNSQIQSTTRGNIGIGFAVPSSTVSRVAEQLIKDGAVQHAWLGVSGMDVDSNVSKHFRLPSEKGVLVNEVTPGSPAAKAGIDGGNVDVIVNGQSYRLGGDVIVKFDGVELETMRQLVDMVNRKEPGDSVEVEFYDDGKLKTEKLKLGVRPGDSPAGAPSEQ